MASRRFIAGAVCPDCRALDRILVESLVDETGKEQNRRRCVSCGFVEIMQDEPRNLALGVPRGKPEQAPIRSVGAQVVKIVDPGAKPARPDDSADD